MLPGLILFILFLGLAGAVVLVQGDARMLTLLAAAAGATGSLAAIVILLVRWRKRESGGSLGRFFFMNWPMLFVLHGLIFGGLLLLLEFRLVLEERVSNGIYMAAGACGAVVLLGLMGGLVMSMGRVRSHPLQSIREELPVKPLGKEIREAIEFQRFCGPRLFTPLIQLWASIGGVCLVFDAAAACIAWWANWKFGPVSWIEIDEWPLLMQFSAMIFLLTTSLAIGGTLLATFRIVNRVKRAGRLKPGEIAKETGYALETIGVKATLIWGIVMVFGLAISVLIASFVYIGFIDVLVLSPWMGIAAAVALFLVLSWFTLVLPQIYIPAIMTRRDCGWMRAFETGLTLMELEGKACMVKAFVATVLALTIVGIPAAVFLLLATLDYQEILVSAILREKSEKEIRDSLTEISLSGNKNLEKFHEALKKGRYLDALNGFQMHMRGNREDLEAMRGEALAYLHMGNPRARESVEFWYNHDSENPEAKQILDELNAGLWGEKGEKFKEADARCTQRIGVGVSGMVARPDDPNAPMRKPLD